MSHANCSGVIVLAMEIHPSVLGIEVIYIDVMLRSDSESEERMIWKSQKYI